MLFNPLYILGLLALGLWLILNLRLSWEVIAWTPDAWRNKAGKLALLWLLPVLGFTVLYRRLSLDWFKSRPRETHDVIGDGLLEIDAFFNPGARHLMHAKQSQQTEMQQDGEPDDRDFDHIDVINTVIPDE